MAQVPSKREFRGVWIATVENIDWPSEKNLSTEDQKKELIKIFDLYKSLNLNAVIFQIRPAADAFYNSKHEPWSFWLTGYGGNRPNPYYDPLAFAIEEAHKRGMEFHAWLNPYRAIINIKELKNKPLPLTYNKPEWFINYGNNKYFDPGNPDVRAYTNQIVADIVQQYDIDAIHFDDYFYPYKIENENFNDDYSFKNYGGDFSGSEREDWRRKNVDLIINQLQNTIKKTKPWVQFGISPFGVWRNKDVDPRGSDTQAGQTNYDDLYADILGWMEKGWIDYVVPQIYWHIGNKLADYKKVAEWWNDNNYGLPVYIGHGLYRLNQSKENKAWKDSNPTELEKQLLLNHSLKNIQGSVYFSGKSFLENPLGINELLRSKFYNNPVLPPVNSKFTDQIPEPVVEVGTEKINSRKAILNFKTIPVNLEKSAKKYLIYYFDQGEEINFENTKNIMALTGETQFEFNRKELKKGVFVIFAVNRYNQMSQPTNFVLH